MSETVCQEKIFKEIFFLHSEYLRNFLYYKSGDLALSEDLVQESYSKLWESCSKVSAKKAKSFLFTVAQNLFLNKAKHNKVVLNYEAQEKLSHDSMDPHYLLEEKEFRIKLENAISDLPEQQRIVFLMNRIDKKKYREIAEELDLSVKAVEKRMHNALKALRQIHKNV